MYGNKYILERARQIITSQLLNFVSRMRLEITGELEEFNVSKETVHYKFDPITLDYDFMLLELDGLSRYEPALLDDGRRSIATKSALSTEIFSIVGWVEPPSEEESYKLHVTNGAELVPSADCQAAYKNKLISGRMACYRSECHPGDR